MRRFGLLLLLTVSTSGIVRAQEALPPGWTNGSTAGPLGSVATVSVPEGYMFLDAKATKAFLEENQNIPDGDELGAVLREMPDKDHWFAIFSYDETGHIDDSDRTIDADALMKMLKEGNEHGNQ